MATVPVSTGVIYALLFDICVSKNLTILLPSLDFTITSSGNFTNSTGAFTYVNTTANTATPSSTMHNITVNLTPTEVYDKISGNVIYYSNGTGVFGAITEPPVTVKFVGADLLLFVPVRVTV